MKPLSLSLLLIISQIFGLRGNLFMVLLQVRPHSDFQEYKKAITKHITYNDKDETDIEAYVIGHFGSSSSQRDFSSIQPRPGKKSVRYNSSTTQQMISQCNWNKKRNN